MQSRLLWLVVIVITVVAAGLLGACDNVNSDSRLTDTTIQGVTNATIEEWSGPAPTLPTLFPVRQGSKWGFIDKTGRLVLGFQYEEAWDFSDGVAAVRVGDDWGFIDESGKMLIAPQFADVGPFFDGRAQLVTDSGIGYIDKTGEVVIPPEFEGAYEFHEGLAGVLLEEGYGFIDTSGEVVIRLRWATTVGDFSEGLAAVRTGGGYGYINRQGGYVIKPQFDGATPFSNGLAVVEYDFFKYELIDTTGRVLKTLDYDQVMGLKEGRAAVLRGGIIAALEAGEDPETSEGSWGFMDESGTLVIPTQFRVTQDFRGGLVRVEEENGKMAYIDLDGNYVWREK